jgi:enoyl-CoA hydratase/carnithine racemase
MHMPDHNVISVAHVDPFVAMVTLARPPHNFIEQPMVSAIADAYETLGEDGSTRAIVLAAEGRNFCAGANFTPSAGDAATAAPTTRMSADTVFETYGQGARIVAAPLTVVAAVRGAAVGGGFGLACTADFRVGGPSSRLVPNFAQLGVHHGFGLTVTLPAIVGPQRASELLFTGRRVGGEEAHRIGLLDRLVPDDEVDTVALALALEIAHSAPFAVRAIRATMRAGLADRFREAARHEAREQERLSASQDFAEGVRAMAQRRPPTFIGA